MFLEIEACKCSLSPSCLIAHLGTASQRKEYMVDRVPMVGWEFFYTEPIAWIFCLKISILFIFESVVILFYYYDAYVVYALCVCVCG